jgi:hypothetical protein
MQDSVTRDKSVAPDSWHEEPWSFFQVPSARFRDYVRHKYDEYPKATISVIALVLLALIALTRHPRSRRRSLQPRPDL